MQRLQDSLLSITKTNSLSPAVFSYLQPDNDNTDTTPLGGILTDTKYGWLALGPKFCVVDLRTGLKIAAWTFGSGLSSFRISVTCVIELPTPLTENSKQLIISLECENITGIICVFHVNGSQILRCIQTETVVTQLAVCDRVPDGPFTCFDGVVMAGTKCGEIFAFDLNRAGLIQALEDISQGNEHLVRNEGNMAEITFLPLHAVPQIVGQRELAVEKDDHIAVLLNENSLVDSQYLFHNPDGTIRMKAKKDHIRISTMQYIPQLGSLVIGYNFGGFQIWNLMTLELEFTSQVNVECLPVTHFGFQEPCDDPRAFCYLWVVYSAIDRYEEEEFPLAVMYSLNYQGKRMLSDTECLYQEFSQSNIRFQIELSSIEPAIRHIGGRCVSCHTYSVNSTLGDEAEESMLNICQLVWECWGANATTTQYGFLLFDLDQWYKDQMPATYQLQSNTFMSATSCPELVRSDFLLDVKLVPTSVAPYLHGSRLEEHFYPNSLQYNCITLSTSESSIINTTGIQRQIISCIVEIGSNALTNPALLYTSCVEAGLTPLYVDVFAANNIDDQRRYILSVALEARLTNFLKRCAHEWATGTNRAPGCSLPFLVDWSWKRAIELKQNAKELTAPLFTSSSLPDRNIIRCLGHCVRQLTDLTHLLDAIFTKCCNLITPETLSEVEEKYKAVGCVALYFQVVQWFLGVGLLPERQDSHCALPYPGHNLTEYYQKRRIKLNRLQESPVTDDEAINTSCSLLYVDQLIDNEFGGEQIHEMWKAAGSEFNGLYPPPSLYSLLRLYLLPEISEQNKHSLVLYLLVDYSTIYDEVRYEDVIRRLMQFPTMFGLSNTAIKATQAFWHLDHRDFDFAIDQLQCLTGNTLLDWQHGVVLSSLLAQRKTQAALQYLHVRKPPPLQNDNKCENLTDWQSCCNLYLARGLVFEALDVIRLCTQSVASLEDKMKVVNYFFKACCNSGLLAKILQISLLPFEEEVFIKYLEDCDDQQTSDILVMYYLQQARYLEAQQYNNKLKKTKHKPKDMTMSLESLLSQGFDREGTRDTLVEVICSSLPNITGKIARAVQDFDENTHVSKIKPLSVMVQPKSPKNTFVYKSSFIQDTIENASETWMNRSIMKRGLKRALNIEETPFLCTPKLNRTASILSQDPNSMDHTPPKRVKLDLGTPKTPKQQSSIKLSDKLNKEMQQLLDMPVIQTPPQWRIDLERSGTPHSILKIRRSDLDRDQASPIDSPYLADSDDEMETASNHTHYSDSKHLRFTIPTPTELRSTPSPEEKETNRHRKETEVPSTSRECEKENVYEEREYSVTSYDTADTFNKGDRFLRSPPKRFASEERIQARKSFKDTVRSRRSMSISASSLSEDPNTSIESIADIPITLINPRFSGERRRTPDRAIEKQDPGMETMEREHSPVLVPKPRKSIRSYDSPARSRSMTPDRQDSPINTPASIRRINRSRSRTPEVSPKQNLERIEEQPRQEVDSEPHADKSTLSIPLPRVLRSRSRSRTPEKLDKLSKQSPKLEAITESPSKSEDEISLTRRSMRSRSRTPEVETTPEPKSPRNLRNRQKSADQEKIMSPIEKPKTRKSLSRMVLEHNAFATTKTVTEKSEETESSSNTKDVLECTPMKKSDIGPNILDVSFSPIVNKSVLHSSFDSEISESKESKDSSNVNQKSLPNFTVNESVFGKSVLQSYESSIAETSCSFLEQSKTNNQEQKLPQETIEFSSVSNKSVLNDVSSLITNDSDSNVSTSHENTVGDDQKMKRQIVEIQREINEFEEDISNSESSESSDESNGDNNENSDEASSDNESVVISIKDSSDNSNNSENALQIDEGTNQETENEEIEIVQQENIEVQQDVIEADKNTQDPLHQASILTDDVSMLESDEEIHLNYSDPDNNTKNNDDGNGNDKGDVKMNDKDDIKSDDGDKNKDNIKQDDGEVTKKSDEENKNDDFSKQEDIGIESNEVAQVHIDVTVEVVTEEIKQAEPQSTETSDKPTSCDIDVVDAVTQPAETESVYKTPAKQTRKRLSSNTSIDKEKDTTLPKTRKRTTSNKSDNSPENTETRRILTRRASKELSESKILDDSMKLEDSISTPKKRTRSKSKTLDDSVSVASDRSVTSILSEESDSKPVRKTRKSVLMPKPDLSVIPEISTDEMASNLEESEVIIDEYSKASRLTRNQKSMLKSWLDNKHKGRQRITPHTSISEETEEDNVSHIDASKTDRDGASDTSKTSPDSITSEITRVRRTRIGRAASETKSVTKQKPLRRQSVDVAPLSPSSSLSTPRRASFTRACAALHTPSRVGQEGKRSESDSRQGSPAPSESDVTTPARRVRRTTSNASNTSTKSRKAAENS